ncbi:hypothetical protein JYB87_11805 [Shewanella avicenniae]|uniref:DUF6950 domain-containing protein n=1 Tax=Shewanella avicenniae TaxID=2814294 RepID=A0ABX7QP10_9GAMM|nr:hypothetical protein [Shewanella avicenniae]QSX32451.1 hypothetical protein JYB87_11805 [Shewanella avicenniae]
MKQHNWPTHLNRYILENLNTPFKWGEFDCCLFAANAVKAMTGEDYAAAFRGKYSTKAGATKALSRYGAGTIKDTITQLLGEPQNTHPARGDVCLIETVNGPTAGIFLNGAVYCPSEAGLMAHKNNEVLAVWRID